MPDRVNIVGPDGKKYTVPRSQLNEALASGYRQASAEEEAIQNYVDNNKGLKGAVKVGLTQLADEFALGVPEAAANAGLGDPLKMKQWNALKEQFPLANAAGGIIGGIASLGYGGGLARAGAKAGEKLVAKTIGNRLGNIVGRVGGDGLPAPFTSNLAAQIAKKTVEAAGRGAGESVILSAPAVAAETLIAGVNPNRDVDPVLAAEKLAIAGLAGGVFRAAPVFVNSTVRGGAAYARGQAEDIIQTAVETLTPKIEREMFDKYMRQVARKERVNISDEMLEEIYSQSSIGQAYLKTFSKKIQQEVDDITSGYWIRPGGGSDEFTRVGEQMEKQFRKEMAKSSKPLLDAGAMGAVAGLAGSGNIIPAAIIGGGRLAYNAVQRMRKDPNAVYDAADKILNFTNRIDARLATFDRQSAVARTAAGLSVNAYKQLSDSLNDPDLSVQVANAYAPLAQQFPDSAAAATSKTMDTLEYLKSQLPKQNPRDPFSSQVGSVPTDTELAKFNRILQATQDPTILVDRLRDGTLTKEEVDAVKTLYPALFERLVQNMMEWSAQQKGNIPYKMRVKMNLLINNRPTQQDTALYQQQFAPKEEGGSSNVNIRPDSIAPMTDTLQMRR